MLLMKPKDMISKDGRGQPKDGEQGPELLVHTNVTSISEVLERNSDSLPSGSLRYDQLIRRDELGGLERGVQSGDRRGRCIALGRNRRGVRTLVIEHSESEGIHVRVVVCQDEVEI